MLRAEFPVQRNRTLYMELLMALQPLSHECGAGRADAGELWRRANGIRDFIAIDGGVAESGEEAFGRRREEIDRRHPQRSRFTFDMRDETLSHTPVAELRHDDERAHQRGGSA